MVAVDGDLRVIEVGEILTSGDVALGEDNAGREENLPAAFVVDAAEIEFVLKFHRGFLSGLFNINNV